MIREKHLKKFMALNIFFGILMIFPLVPIIIFEYPFDLSIEELKIISFLVIWTGMIVWFVRLRGIQDTKIIIPILILICGQVITCYILLSYFVGGLVTIFFSSVIPYIYSSVHVSRLKKIVGI